GWKHAQGMNDYGHFYIYEDVNRKLADTPIPPLQRHFHPNDLDVVLKAAKTWCDAHAATLNLHYFPSGSAKDCWQASVAPFAAETHSDDAGTAVLAACVIAHRQATQPTYLQCEHRRLQ